MKKYAEKETMKISYWSDYNCPYCYIGITRLNKAIKELNLKDVKMDIHSFELDPNAPQVSDSNTLERFAEKYNLSKEDAQKEIDKITQWANDEDLEMKYDTAKFTNTRDAHRLSKLAIESNNQEIINKYNELLFKAYFVENLELADKDVLKKVAVESGLDEERVVEVLNSDKFNNEVELDERVALGTGIQGVPYFIFNNRHAVPGALPTSEFINVLRKIKFEEDIAKEYEAQQCNSNSC